MQGHFFPKGFQKGKLIVIKITKIFTTKLMQGHFFPKGFQKGKNCYSHVANSMCS